MAKGGPVSMKIALLTGPSGAGKTFVADQLRTQFDCLSYDRLMRDSIQEAFPEHDGEKWDKQVWLDNSDRVDLVRAFERAFAWSGKHSLLIEGWQLRERVWRQGILDLATSRAQAPIEPELFVIQPTLELLVSERAHSKHEYHRRHADIADCQRQTAIHERLYREQPWDGDVCRLPTKEAAVDAVRVFLSTE
jgi:adenylate kinase family enzyme